MVKHTQTIRRQIADELSVFVYLEGLALKALKYNYFVVKNKQASHYKPIIKTKTTKRNTFSTVKFSFLLTFFIFSLIYCAVSEYLIDTLFNTWSTTSSFFLSIFFYHSFTTFSNVSCAQDGCTKYLNISSALKISRYFYKIQKFIRKNATFC